MESKKTITKDKLSACSDNIYLFPTTRRFPLKERKPGEETSRSWEPLYSRESGVYSKILTLELIWHLIWDLIWAQMRLDRGIENFEVEKCRWHFSINHDVVKQPAKYEFLIPSSFEVRIWLVNRLSFIFNLTLCDVFSGSFKIMISKYQ